MENGVRKETVFDILAKVLAANWCCVVKEFDGDIAVAGFDRNHDASLRIWQSVEDAIHGFFNIVFRTTRFPKDSLFQRLAAAKKGETSLYRAQLVERFSFSTGCQSLYLP
jgi:hypothetical protein